MCPEHDGVPAARAGWMGLLARAPLEMLERWASAAEPGRVSWLRRPEPGLVMVRGRIGGTGNKFNLGEMTVTRCALRLGDGAVGVAWVQGRSSRKCEIAALADALLQVPERAAEVRRNLLEPLAKALEAEILHRRRKTQATRVEFFTVARGDS